MSWFSVILILFLAIYAPATLAADVTEVNPALMTQQGIAAFKRGDYAAALKTLALRARQTPEDPIVYYYLGNCYLQAKQNDQAAHMFSACVRVSPTSRAGRYALSALEHMSASSKSPTQEIVPPPGPDPAATAAARDSLMSEAALDKHFNDAVRRIQSQRQTVKIRIDRVWSDLEDDLVSMSPKLTANYAAELERVRREAENKVEDMQIKELRFESRQLAPEKIDVRAVPQMPQEKADDSKNALGSLAELFKPDKPYDPFGTDVKPEVTAKFMTLKDVFGDLSTYQPSARKMAKQVFMQLKSSIESKQDQFDQQVYQLKANLIRDMADVKASYGNSTNNLQLTPSFHLTSSKIPRGNQNNTTPMDAEVSQTTERAKRRIKELEDGYYRDVDSYISGAKERIGGMVAQVGQMNRQLQHPSGNIMIVPIGTDVYTRNYVNFADRSEPQQAKEAASKIQPLRAQAKKLPIINHAGSPLPPGSK